MERSRLYPRGLEGYQYAVTFGQPPSTSVVLEAVRRSFPNANTFHRHLVDELENEQMIMASCKKDAIELWSSMAQEQAREFDWALSHKLVRLRSGGPNRAPASGRRVGLSREPAPDSSATGRAGYEPNGGRRTMRRWSNRRPALSASGTYEVILLCTLNSFSLFFVSRSILDAPPTK